MIHDGPRIYVLGKNFALFPCDYRAEIRRSFITTTVREESQVTPQGRHGAATGRVRTGDQHYIFKNHFKFKIFNRAVFR